MHPAPTTSPPIVIGVTAAVGETLKATAAAMFMLPAPASMSPAPETGELVTCRRNLASAGGSGGLGLRGRGVGAETTAGGLLGPPRWIKPWGARPAANSPGDGVRHDE